MSMLLWDNQDKMLEYTGQEGAVEVGYSTLTTVTCQVFQQFKRNIKNITLILFFLRK